MDLNPSGKVAVVTAASKGIGLAVARALADEGAKVVAGARSLESLAGISGVTPVSVDLATPAGPRRLVERVVMLASSRAGNVTGANFVIDGGLVKSF